MKKLKAASMIESVIAIVILTICSLFSTLMFLRVVRDGGTTIMDQKMQIELDKTIYHTLMARDSMVIEKPKGPHSIGKTTSIKEEGTQNQFKQIDFTLNRPKKTVTYRVLTK